MFYMLLICIDISNLHQFIITPSDLRYHETLIMIKIMTIMKIIPRKKKKTSMSIQNTVPKTPGND